MGNPTKVNVAKIIRAPPTSPPPTTTILPAFNEHSCDCVADFLLLLYSTPSFDRGLKEEVHLDWSVGARKDQHEIFEGAHTSQHALPLTAQSRDLSEGCYCVQQADYYTSTAISTSAPPGTTATTPWTPAVTANTTETLTP